MNASDKGGLHGGSLGPLTPIPGDASLSQGRTPGSANEQKDLSPISKIMYGSPDGMGNRSSPSGIPVSVNSKNSPTPFFPVTPRANTFSDVPEFSSYDEITSKLPNKLSAAAHSDSLPSQASRGASTTPKNRSSTSSIKSHVKKPSEIPATTPVRRSSMSLNTSVKKNKMSIVVPSTTIPLPLPSRVVKVAVRVRPFSQLEIEDKARRIVSYCGNKMVIVNPAAFDADPDAIALAAATVECKEWAQVFLFNHVLW